MNSIIHSFIIRGLFGNREVHIPFENDAMILIGENGLGKTTILNAFYFIISGKLEKLRGISFQEIELNLNSGNKIVIKKEDLINLDTLSEEGDFRGASRIRDYMTKIEAVLENDEKADLQNIFHSNRESDRNKINHYVRILSDKIDGLTLSTRRALNMLFEGNLFEIKESIRKVNAELSSDILYYPTYRRIEEELRNLGVREYKSISAGSRTIKFGMQDVREIWDKNLDIIRRTTIEEYSSITGELLRQYLAGAPKSPRGIKSKIKNNVHNIVLDRIGDSIEERTKNKIKSLIISGDIFESQYSYLLNLLSHLINIYDRQKELDDRIKKFADICTGYLFNKKVVYNESKVSLEVYQEQESEPINLKYLSSGEKQVLSLFTSIFLEYTNSFIVLFDEPELSLSIEWQRKLLPDIIASGRCKFLLAVTHSPFIFDNFLENNAKDLFNYVK